MAEDFKRKRENFVCKNCKFEVKGTGYTDHCPKCLWSRHVDISPGDRAAKCKGMMEPVGAEIGGDRYIILYRCTKCGHRRRNIAAQEDNVELIMELLERGRRGD
ncbi:MAG: RNHCP domain-containing protein [Candidatus Micrarchaeia archaeon]